MASNPARLSRPRAPVKCVESRLSGGRFDRLGIIMSGLCALHCAVSLVLVSMLGFAGTLLLHPAIHKVGLVIAVLVATATIGVGAVRRWRTKPVLLATCGIASLGAALSVGHGIEELPLTVLGLALIASAHWTNMRRT